MGNESSKRMEKQGIRFISFNNKYYFAESSCYDENSTNSVFGEVKFADPLMADTALTNANELHGKIVVVERGGRIPFPDIMKKLIDAKVIGCLFIEKEKYLGPQSTFDGFHSSGKRKVDIPILRISVQHADEFLKVNPSKIGVHRFFGKQAMNYMVLDDIPVGVNVAARHGDTQVLRSLLEEAKSAHLMESLPAAFAYCDAVENGYIDCVEVLKEYLLPINAQKPNGTSALMTACSLDNIEAARALIMYGANIELEDAHGMTALMIATREHAVSCVKYLIRKGAAVILSRNRTRGTTPLHIAARGGSGECLKLLIGARAPLNVESPNMSTALMEAARAGHLICVRLLTEAGAKLDATDREGNTAEMLARNAGYDKIEDYLVQHSQSHTISAQRQSVEDLVNRINFSLHDLLVLAEQENIEVDILKREVLRNPNTVKLMEKESVMYDVFRIMTTMPNYEREPDPVYGYYRMQYFCSEVASSYERRLFEASAFHDLDKRKCFGFFKVIFNFVKHTGALDEVVLVLFSKLILWFILRRQMGGIMLEYLGSDGSNCVPWLARHIGYDAIRDIVTWLCYSDLSDTGQRHIRQSGIIPLFFSRMCTWQRTLSWGVGTSFQRDSVENISSFICGIVDPPAVSTLGEIITLVDNVDDSLPIITDQASAGQHHYLFRSLLDFILSNPSQLGNFMDLGFAELKRQATKTPEYLLLNGGCLSIVMTLLNNLGYHRRKLDITCVENQLRSMRMHMIKVLQSRIGAFVALCKEIATADKFDLKRSRRSLMKMKRFKGNALLSLVNFIKGAIFLQSAMVDNELANAGCIPTLLSCFQAHPSNNILHHALTDVIRFILLDPAQSRLPSCPLLNSLFIKETNILSFVMRAYHPMNTDIQYRGHMTTVGNSINTLTNTPTCNSFDKKIANKPHISVQEVVRQYTSSNAEWIAFAPRLAKQNFIEHQSLGHRNAPLCDGCLALNLSATSFVADTLDGDMVMNGYLETIFKGVPIHYCKVIPGPDFISGYLYKKDKKHDHIPIPEPTRVSSFVQFPVPMPFHALTFTVSFVGLCRKCDKLWYCDTLNSPNWNTRMKWVVPTSVRRWYSFGTTEGPGSDAHGIQFSTKGYKNFLMVTDTWGRQEQWIRAIEESILGISRQSINSSSQFRPPAKRDRCAIALSSPDAEAAVAPKSGQATFSKFQPKTSSPHEIVSRKQRTDFDLPPSNKEASSIRHVVSTSDLSNLAI